MNSPDKDKQDPQWDSFETYKGPPLKELPDWVSSLLRTLFTALGLAFVFVISGGFLWLVVYRYAGNSFALNEQSWMSWSRFLAGGMIGVFFAIKWWRRA